MATQICSEPNQLTETNDSFCCDTLDISMLKEALSHDVIVLDNGTTPQPELIFENTILPREECLIPLCQKRIVEYSESEESDNYENVQPIPEGIHKSDRSEDERANSISSNSSPGEVYTSGNDSNDSTSISSENFEIRGKKRKKMVKKSEKNRKRRWHGLSYFTYKNTKVDEKKVLPNPCLHKDCKNKCNSFTEIERQTIFSLFWNLGRNLDKRSFINGCVNIIPVKRKRTQTEESRRNLTYQYFLMKGKTQVQVCLQFFLATLNITQKLVRNSITGKIKGNTDRRGKHEPKHKASAEQMNELRNFIERLPAVPSHYCRSSTSKLYLPADIKSVANLYRMYTAVMKEKGVVPVKISSFRTTFKKDYNIGIHVPRKDKCVKCEKYKNLAEKDKTEDQIKEYLAHQKEKDDAKQLFLREQSISDKNGFLVISFDLQKVLSTPHGPSMIIGFSRKYAVYNFTIYESKTQNAYCYIWEEKDGKRGVNEISTHLYNYLVKLDLETTHRSISLFCDNCPGQNKNRIILTMLMYFLKNSSNLKEIMLTYLVAGHTYMPVDSVHAVIEKHISKMTVEGPSEWLTLVRNSRKAPRPYDVIPINYAEFLDWKALVVHKKLISVEKTEIKFSDIKRVSFSKNNLNSIDVALSYDSNAAFLRVELPIKKLATPPRLYNTELPLNKKKLKNLHDLCRNLTIKKQYHAEYFALSSDPNIPDELPETDVEDDK